MNVSLGSLDKKLKIQSEKQIISFQIKKYILLNVLQFYDDKDVQFCFSKNQIKIEYITVFNIYYTILDTSTFEFYETKFSDGEFIECIISTHKFIQNLKEIEPDDCIVNITLDINNTDILIAIQSGKYLKHIYGK